MKTIIEMYLEGEINDKNINKWLEEETIHWNGGDGSVEMWQHLGFSNDTDYRKWSSNSSYLLELKKENENNRPKLAAN